MNYDVAIIGAGAAGLALGQKLRGQGLSVAIFEARNRTGGRALTDTGAFGVPFDRGCAYLHHAKKNPFYSLARSNGMALVRVRGDDHSAIWHDGKEASEADYIAAELQYDALEQALLSSGKKGEDRAASDVVRNVPRSKWFAMAESWLEFGCNLQQASSLDWYKVEGGEDYLCKAGFGSLVGMLANGLTIHLNTEVQEVHWQESPMRLITPRGTVTCRVCVVTVPVAVLNASRLLFQPDLPVWKQDALQSMTSAQYVTMGLRFATGNVLPVDSCAWLFPWTMASSGTVMVLNDAAGNGICRAEAGGDKAIELLELGERTAIASVLDLLCDALGNDVRRKFVAGLWTDWRSDPHALGAWSWARPGYSHKRTLLAESLEGRVHFAGEACHATMFATCHGAMLSGIKTAKQILADWPR